MADNNLSSSIAALINNIKSEIPNANPENLKRLARSVRKLGYSGDATIDTLINNRANALTATADATELQTIAEAINQVDDTSNPTGATNVNADVHVGDAAPESAVNGDLWWKTDDLNLYVYYEDGDGAQWIQANSTVVTGAVPSDISELTDTTGLLGSGGATVYADMAALVAATGMSSGDLALVTATNNMYIYSGASWYKIATVQNDSPTAITGVAESYTLADDGTPTVITAVSTDPDGFALTWSYSTSGLGSIATVSQADNVFTITPSNDIANAGTFSITITASDGVNVTNKTSSISLVNDPPIAITGVDGTYELATDGTPTVITAVSSDPEGTPLTWTYSTSGLGSIAAISQVDNVFTITPSTDSANAGTFTLTLSATDGVSTVTVNTDISLVFGPAASSVIFTTPGTHSWVVPDGLTSISAVVVGAGGSGGSAGANWSAAGGSGGGLAWMSNISVTPGDTLYVRVAGSTAGQTGGSGTTVGGLTGGDSWISYGSSTLSDATRIVQGTGGGGGAVDDAIGQFLNGAGQAWPQSRGIAVHGTEHASTSGTTSGGGSGGRGGANYNDSDSSGGSGGGAGGYTGQGGDYNAPTPVSGTGAGACAAYTWNGSGNAGGDRGGGVGVYGKGLTGIGGSSSTSRAGSGGNGTDPTAVSNSPLYGAGGAGKGNTYSTSTGGQGWQGAVRIIWGDGRSYPDTNTTNDYNVDPETTV